MGFFKAFSGSLAGTFADQWKDFYSIPDYISPTVGVCAAERTGSSSGRGANRKATDNLVSDGSLFLVPEGYALITLENGRIVGYSDEPGGYEWRPKDIQSSSIFSGGTLNSSVLRQSFERFKFGGIPGVFQRAIYVNLKEIAGNRFGTNAPVYWDDSYLNSQVGIVARGTYSVKITNPILFVKEYLPVEFYQGNAGFFDFADYSNASVQQLFNEVVSSLSASFSKYSNNQGKAMRISDIQGDSVGFCRALGEVVDSNYAWKANRGIEIYSANISAIDYDASTKDLLAKVQLADAMTGARGSSNLQASFAQGISDAGSGQSGALGLGVMAMGMQGVSAMVSPFLQQPQAKEQENAHFEQLKQAKELLDNDLISQEDYEAVKRRVLGL